MLFTHDDVYTRQTQKEEREREIDGGGYEREADRMIGLISKTTPSHNRKRFYFYSRLPIISPLFLVVCLMYNNNKKKPPDLYIQRKSLLHPSMAIGNTHTQKLNIVFRIKKNQSKVHCFQPNR
jgi:hypothetical protein